MPNTLEAAQVDRLLATMLRETNEYAVLLTDELGTIQWLNRAAERILGLDSQGVIGQLLDATFIPADVEAGAPAQERTIALELGVAHDDRWHQRADGSTVWSSGLLIAVREEDSQVTLCKIFRNRTDFKEQLTLLENSARAARQGEERYLQSLAMIAHELRTPLSAVFNTTAILKHRLSGNTQLRVPLEILERQLGVLRRQVDDLLDVARMTTGKIQLELAPTLLQDIVVHAAETVLPDPRERESRVVLVLPQEPVTVIADATRMRQVFINLLANSLKFSHAQDSIQVSMAVADREALTYVKDSGVGIPKDLLPRIFELFTQADGTAQKQGLGIGLALVRELISLHGGSVQVRSDGPGQGAEFTVRLPLAND